MGPGKGRRAGEASSWAEPCQLPGLSSIPPSLPPVQMLLRFFVWLFPAGAIACCSLLCLAGVQEARALAGYREKRGSCFKGENPAIAPSMMRPPLCFIREISFPGHPQHYCGMPPSLLLLPLPSPVNVFQPQDIDRQTATALASVWLQPSIEIPPSSSSSIQPASHLRS